MVDPAKAPRIKKAPDVETQPCPAGGTHALTNTSLGEAVVTHCGGCGALWVDLDAQLRLRNSRRQVVRRG